MCWYRQNQFVIAGFVIAGFVPTYFTVILPCIRPVSEYACQVFRNGLPEYLSEELEKIQRRALLLRIIFPDLGYQEALKECNIATLHQRRQWLTERLFNEIKDNSLHKLHGLLPPRNSSIYRSLKEEAQF